MAQQAAQQFPCANGCSTPLTVADNAGGGLITVSVNGHAKAAHRVCPTPTAGRTGE